MPRAIPAKVGLAVLALALAACASTGEAGPGQSRMQKLAADCQARGGILTASGAVTGRPEVDNVCTIRGGAPRP